MRAKELVLQLWAQSIICPSFWQVGVMDLHILEKPRAKPAAYFADVRIGTVENLCRAGCSSTRTETWCLPLRIHEPVTWTSLRISPWAPKQHQKQRSQSITLLRTRSFSLKNMCLNACPNIWERDRNQWTSMDELRELLTSGSKTNCWERTLQTWAAKCQQFHIHKACGSLFTDSNGLQNLTL